MGSENKRPEGPKPDAPPHPQGRRIITLDEWRELERPGREKQMAEDMAELERRWNEGDEAERKRLSDMGYLPPPPLTTDDGEYEIEQTEYVEFHSDEQEAPVRRVAVRSNDQALIQSIHDSVVQRVAPRGPRAVEKGQPEEDAQAQAAWRRVVERAEQNRFPRLGDIVIPSDSAPRRSWTRWALRMVWRIRREWRKLVEFK